MEPTELSAILPGPLSHVVVVVIGHILKRDSVVLVESDARLVGVLLHDV